MAGEGARAALLECLADIPIEGPVGAKRAQPGAHASRADGEGQISRKEEEGPCFSMWSQPFREGIHASGCYDVAPKGAAGACACAVGGLVTKPLAVMAS